MKRIYVNLIIGLFVCGLTSCEDKLADLYTNPDQTSQGSIGKFFTRMLNNDRVRPSYWNVRTFLVMHPAKYTQTVSFTNSERRYMQQLSYIDDFWRDYYTPTGAGIIAHLREMEKLYAAMPEEGKSQADVYMNAAKVVCADQTSQMVDLWGDIPFAEAGGLNLKGSSVPAVFDDAKIIYARLLEMLEDASAYFANAELDSRVQTAFSQQDILLNGSVEGWQRYANSVRLRLLMRISFENENLAQAEVMEMLNNPGAYPLVDEAAHDVLLEPLSNYNDNMRNALVEVSSHVAPEFLLDQVMKPAGDPRIRVWFDKNSSGGVQNADYFSMPSNISSTVQDANISQGRYAILDSATFLFNRAFPGIVITSAEVNFLKAEALQRWGAENDARTAYEKGVEDAVRFMFYLNQLGGGAEDPLTQEELESLLANPLVAYAGTPNELLSKIWTQKWLHFGFMQSIQGWAELRRTKVPALTFVPDLGTPDAQLPPSRLIYPSSEKTYNSVNYAAVAEKDTPIGKIFWDVRQ